MKHTPDKKNATRFQLEMLEPRLMFSADFAGVFASDLSDEHEAPQDGFEALPLAMPQPLMPQQDRHELVIVDRNAPDYELMVDDIRAQYAPGRTLDILLLDPDENGVEQISEALAGYDDLDAIHIVSHAQDGAVQLGDSWLDAEALAASQGAISDWAEALDADADMLFYGCDLAASDSGVEFLQTLSGLTGADVAASDDRTGASILGGDWVLEYTSGAVETRLAFTEQLQARFDNVLANTSPLFSNLDAFGAYTEDQPAAVLDSLVGAIDAELDALNGGAGDYDGASLRLERDTGRNGSDVFGFSDGNGITLVGDELRKNGQSIAEFDDDTNGRLDIRFTNSNGEIPTTADVAFVFSQITYRNTSTVPPASVPLSWTLNDGNSGAQSTGGNLSANAVQTVVITQSNDAPILSGIDRTHNYTEGGGARVLDDSVDFGDPELDQLAGGDGNYAGMTVTLARAGGANAEDVFGFNDGGGESVVGSELFYQGDRIGYWDTSTPGQVTLTFTDDNGFFTESDHINHYLERITYRNDGALPTGGIQIEWTANDGNTGSQGVGGEGITTATTTITTTGFNAAPALNNLQQVVTLIENSGGIALHAGVDVSDTELDAYDAGVGNYAGASFTIARQGGANPDDLFGFSDGNGITLVGSELHKSGVSIASFDTSTAGELVINYTDANGQKPTSADVDAIHNQIMFDTVSDMPADSSVDLRWVFNDGNTLEQGNGGAYVSIGSTTVAIIPRNDAATFTGLDNNPVYNEGGFAVVLDSDVSITDPETDALNGGNGDYDRAVLTLSRNGGANADDLFGFIDGSGISLSAGNLIKNGQVIASFDTSVGGELTVTFTSANGEIPTTADLTAIARQLVYANASEAAPTSVQIDWELQDAVDPDWWDHGWSERVELTFNNALSNTNLVDFPVLVELTGTDVDFDLIRAGGQDLRFVDTDGTLLDFEIDSWNDVAETASIWVKVPQVDANSVIDSIYLYYGNPTAASIESPADVWTAGYVGVWHLNETVTNEQVGGVHVDSASGLNGTQNNNNESNGIIGNSQEFDNNRDVIQIADNDALSFTNGVSDEAFSISAWIEPDTDDGVIFGKYSTSFEYELFIEQDELSLVLYDPGGDYLGRFTTADLTYNTWQHVAATYDGSGTAAGIKLFVDGVQQATTVWANGDYDGMQNTSELARIGGLNATGSQWDFDGKIDEVRLSSGVRSADWVEASYLNQRPGSGFVSIGTVERNQDAGGVATGSGSIDVTIAIVNDEPVLGGLNATPTFQEGLGPVALDSSVTVSDFELDSLNNGNGDYDGASLTVGRTGALNADDTYFFVPGNGITQSGSDLIKNGQVIASFDTGTAGELLVTFTNANGEVPTTADVNAIASQIAYRNTSDVPPANVVLDWAFNDGNVTEQGSGGALEDTGAITVTIQARNDAPVFADLDGGETFAEYPAPFASPPIQMDPDFSISDPELDALNGGLGDYTGASITFGRDGGLNAEDRYLIQNANGITVVGSNILKGGSTLATFDRSTAGEMTIHFLAATTADVNDIMRQAVYFNTNENAPASIDMRVTFNDGNVLSQGLGGDEEVSAVIPINIVLWNEKPNFSGLDATPTFVEDSPAVVLDANVTVSDAELDPRNAGAGDYDGAVLSLARNGGASAEDVFGFNDGNGISQVAGTLVKNGQVIASFDTSVAGALAITFTNSNGETPTTADVNAIAQQLTYSNSSDLPPASVQIDWELNDGEAPGYNLPGSSIDTGSIVVAIDSINETPSFTGLDADPTYIEDQPAIVLDADVAIADPELDTLNGGAGDYSGAILNLERDLAASPEDVFGFNNGSGITLVGSTLLKNSQVIASFDTSAAGVLTVTFTNANGEVPTTADVNSVAQQITYLNSSDLPPAGAQINWSLSDGNVAAQGSGGALIANGSLNLTLVGVNETPGFINLDANPTFAEDGAAIVIDADVSLVDKELDLRNGGSGNYSGASLVLVRNSGADAEDIFGFVDGNGISLVGNALLKNGEVIASFDTSSAGVLTIKFTDDNGETPDSSDAASVARQITYSNSSDVPPVNVSIDWTLDDGGAPEWWHSDWSDRVEIVVDNSASGTDLTDFPLLIRLTAADVDFSKIASGGADLRFATADGQQLAYEIDSWDDIAETAAVWVKVPAVEGGNDSNIIYMYHNNSAAADKQNAAAVWADSFGSWHLDEDPGPGLAGDILDSSAQSNNGTAGAGQTAADSVDGVIGDAIRFDAIGDHVGFGSVDLQDNFTISVWVKPEAGNTGSMTIIANSPIGANTDGFRFFFRGDSGAADAGMLRFETGSGSDSNSANSLAGVINFGQWNHIAAEVDSANGLVKLYHNGVDVTANGVTRDDYSVSSDFDVGQMESGGFRFIGEMDELRIDQVARSADWVDAAYRSQAPAQSVVTISNALSYAAFADNKTVTETVIVDIDAANDQPGISGLDNTPTFVEDLGAVVLDSSVTISDLELDSLNGGSGDYNGASLTLARTIAANGDDVFGFNAGNGITQVGSTLVKNGQVIASFDTATAGELTISFTNANGEIPTTADVSAIAQQITYSNSSDLPPASAQIDWNFSDGNVTAQGTGGALDATGSITVGITSVNENPAFTGLDNTPTFIEDQPAIVLDSNVTLSDPELDLLNGGAGDYSGASLTLARTIAANGDDVFGFNAGSGITQVGSTLVKNGQVIASFDTATAGELTITFTNANGETPTTSDVSAIAQQITYSNTNDLPPASVQIDWTLNDGNGVAQGSGGALGATGAITVGITSVNENPGFTGLDNSPTFVEDLGAVVLDGDVTLNDPELDLLNGGAGDYSGASLTLARTIAANGEDVFAFNAGSGITQVGSTLVKNGQVIASFDTATAGELAITFTNANGETPTTADVSAIAQQITYSNTNDLPPASVQIDWTLDDGNGVAQGTGGALGATGSITVGITSVNENPAFTGLDNTPTFVEDLGAVVLDSNVTLSDPELDLLNGGNGDYNGASLTLARTVTANGDDVFGFNAGSGITQVGSTLVKNGQVIASFDTATAGELTISFTNANGETPTTADVSAIAQQITYSNTNDLPPASVQIDWTLNDGNGTAQGTGGALAATGSITVGITSVNENPGFTGLDNSPTFIEDQPAIVLDGNVTLSDPELDLLNGGAGDYNGASLTLARTVTANGDDVFGFNAGSGITQVGSTLVKNGQVIASFDTATAGELTITFTNANGETPTTADVSAIAQQITYSNSNDLPPASVQIDWTLNDGNGVAQGSGGALSASGAITVGITAVNENPTFTDLNDTPTFVEDLGAIVLDGDVTVGDPELDLLNGGAGDYSGASLTLVRNIAANGDDVFGFNAGSGISQVGSTLVKNGQVIASFDTATAGELTITFTNANGETPTTADVSAVAQQITYSNTNDLPPASVQIDWTLNDGNGTAQGAGGALDATGSITVGITSVNENPAFTGLDNTPTFIEDQTAIVLDGNVSLSDPELDLLNGGAGDYSGASLTLARTIAANGEDVFGFNAGSGITQVGSTLVKNGQVIASFDTATAGELTITFTNANGETPTTADVSAIAQQITYSNSNDLPPTSVQIDWTLDDGNGVAQGSGGALAATGSITVGITSVNEAPTFTDLDDTPIFVEDLGAVVLDGDVTLNDPELDLLNGGAGDYSGASLTLARTVTANGDDVFGFNAGSGITQVGSTLVKNGQVIASFDTATSGELTITFTNANGETPTTADVSAIAQQITYSNINDLPPASVQIDWTLDDGNGTAQGAGGALDATGSITVGITSVNENPAFTGLENTPTFVEDLGAVVLDGNVTLSDPELNLLNGGAGDYNGASLTLARTIAANGDDVFGFNAGSGITQVGSTLVKNGQVIASFDTATSGELTITFTNANGETPTTADVSAIAQQITYSNTNDLPPASVQIDWTLSDGNGTAQGSGGALDATGSITVGITSVNENPGFTGLDISPTFIEDQPAIVLDADVTLSDPELDLLNGGAGDYSGASLTLARTIAANGEDVFGFNAGSGITQIGSTLVKNGQVIASFDTATAGELTITFTNANGETPTTADVSAIAQQITYSNTNDLPPASVQIDWTLNDGNGTAQGSGGALDATGSITVGITSVNENPGFTGLDNTPTFIEDLGAVVLDGNVTLSDPELDLLNGGAGDYNGASLTLARTVTANGDDVFGFNAGSGITQVGSTLVKNGQVIASFDTATVGELTITFTNANGETPTTADVSAIAQQITYSNSNDLPPASVQIDWTLNDGNGTAQGAGGGLAATGSITVGITSVNENPAFTGLDNTPTFIEDQPAIALDGDVTLSDPELDLLNGGAGDYSGASLTLARTIAANGEDVFGFNAGSGITQVGSTLVKNGQVIASFDTATPGELTITFTNANGEIPTTADVSAIAQQITYSNSSDLPPASVQIDWTLNDGNGVAQGTGGALGAAGSITVGITSVNENPAFTGLDNAPTFIEDQPAIVLDGDVTLSDPELDLLNGGAGDYSGASLTLARTTAANGDDVFGFNAGSGITQVGSTLVKNGQVIASFDTATAGEVTITFTNANGEIPTTADVSAIAQQITYSNSSDLPPASVQIDWTLNDGNGVAQGSGGALDASGSVTVGITSVNESPVLTGLDNTPTFVEDQPAVVLDNNVVIADPELDMLAGGAGDYDGASVVLARSGMINSDDLFGFADGNGISLAGNNLLKNGQVIASFDTSFAGELTISFTNANGEIPTSADVNAIQRQITYSNSNDLPPASVDLDWDFHDGNSGAQGIGGMLSAGGTITVNIASVNDTPQLSGLDNQFYLEDSAAVILDADVVLFDPELNIIGDHDGASLTLLRSGLANADDVFGFTPGNGISLSGSDLMKNGSVIGGFDTSVPGQLTITFSSAAGEIPATADINAVARQITYNNSSDLPPPSIVLDWTLADGNSGAQGVGANEAVTVSQTITIGSVNEAPAIIGLDNVAAYTEDQPAVVLDADVVLADRELDSMAGGAGNYSGASLTLERSTGANAEDEFSFTASGGISRVGDTLIKNGAVIAQFDTASQGQLRLVFTDANGELPTSADVNTIAQGISYSNSAEIPPAQVQIDWRFSDGNAGAQGAGGVAETVASSLVQITSVDDTAPLQEANTGSNLATGTTDLLSITELRYSDSEQDAGSVTYTITSSTSSGFVALASAPETPVTNFTQAQIDAGEVVYVHTNVGTEFDSFDFVVTDGQGNTSAADTFGIQIEVQDTQSEALNEPRAPTDPLPIIDLDLVDSGFSPVDVSNPPLQEYNRTGGIFEDAPVAGYVENETVGESDVVRVEPVVMGRGSGEITEEQVRVEDERDVRSLRIVDVRADTSLIRSLDTERHDFTDLASFALEQQLAGENEPQTAAETLLFALDDMREQLESSLAEQYTNELLLSGSARMAGVTLSAGYLAWLLRAGPLLASVAASVPTWARFDPLPVVLTPADEEEERTQSGEDELERQQEEAATYLLDKNAAKGHSNQMEGRDA